MGDEPRSAHIKRLCNVDLDDASNAFEKAALSLVLWTQIIEQLEPDLTYRIEDGADRLYALCQTSAPEVEFPPFEQLNLAPVNQNKRYKGKTYDKPQMSKKDWDQLSPSTQDLIVDYCRKYEYESPFQL